MSFADEIKKMKSLELTDKEFNEILKRETLENKENNISEVSNMLIQMIKDDFRIHTPEEEYKKSIFGKRIYNGKKILRASLIIPTVVYNHAGRIRLESIDHEEYNENVIYADKASIKNIRNIVESWIEENDIIIDEVLNWGRDGFRYNLKMYL